MEGLFRALVVIRDWHRLLHFRTVTQLLHLAMRLLSPVQEELLGDGAYGPRPASRCSKFSVVKGCDGSVFNRVSGVSFPTAKKRGRGS